MPTSARTSQRTERISLGVRIGTPFRLPIDVVGFGKTLRGKIPGAESDCRHLFRSDLEPRVSTHYAAHIPKPKSWPRRASITGLVPYRTRTLMSSSTCALLRSLASADCRQRRNLAVHGDDPYAEARDEGG